jgi:hypothetical protein
MLALKIFLCSLLAGAGGGYLGFRFAVWVALKFLKGENAQPIAVLIGFAAALAVGVCSAITAGVLAGRAAKDRGLKL